MDLPSANQGSTSTPETVQPESACALGAVRSLFGDDLPEELAMASFQLAMASRQISHALVLAHEQPSDSRELGRALRFLGRAQSRLANVQACHPIPFKAGGAQ